MTSTLPTDPRSVEPKFAADHPDHWRRLQEELRFRNGQLTELDAERPATPRHESVRNMLRASAAAALAEVEAALARMKNGTYGSCVICERPLDPERLAILPMASLCMGCHYNEQNCRVADLYDTDRR